MIELRNKYTFKIENGVLVCLRYGEPWRDVIGDNAVLALFRHAETLEEKLEADRAEAAEQRERI